MSRSSLLKKERQQELAEKLKEDPFLTDEELAELFSVSVPTIRLDRLEMGIPELRERIKDVAEKNYSKVKSLQGGEIIGELIDITLGKYGVSILETDDSMAFERTRIIRGHYIYSLAESLAIAVIDADVALVGVANIKYKNPVYSGTRLVAKAEVRQIRGSKYIVWVKIYEKQVEMFRGKFILVSLEKPLEK
ncbi:MAG: transcription factor FapR [Acetivibrionales bacterium]|jgi:acyl-coenzyme A thioesterase PaaI-like protein|nr:transcription factor FapR [Bacillota bacterium]NLP07037.1 transcription factor FapR [Clostridiaceae bacterium]HOA55612.1 transcription factor FapR [Clostridiales bacterium]HPZ05553.1 transcription factor FapR [Clostridiales bacterium]HQD31023.1 transcription factor FapR [Clostridiales bacterium]